jgi:EmrB/QacA subfamily drug resistance transporter
VSQVEAPVTAAPEISAETWRLAWVIAFGAFAGGLDISIVNIALNTIRYSFHTSLSDAQWISSGYLLALAVSLPACAWLGRRIGVGRLWLGSLVCFIIISALCAAAPTIGVLIGLRVLQGLAAGLLVPAGQTALGQAVGPGRLGRVMARLGIAVVLAPALGPVVGGLILHALSWRWLFLINVPVGIMALIFGLRWIPHEKGVPTSQLDVVGFAYIGLGLPLIVYGLTNWGADGAPRPMQVLLPLALGIAGLAAFTLHAVRREHPLLNLGLYRNTVYRMASIAFFFNGALTFGCALIFPLYFQLLYHDDTVAAGLAVLPLAAGTALTLPTSGRLTDRYGGGPVAAAGTGLALVATTVLAVIGAQENIVLTLALLFALGMGTGMATTPLMIAAFATAPRDKLPDATALVNIVARIGGALGAAMFTVVLARALTAGTAHAFSVAFTWQCRTAIAALVTALLLWLVQSRLPGRERRATSPHG